MWAGQVEISGTNHTARAELIGASQQAPAPAAAAVGKRGGADTGQDQRLMLLPMLALAPTAADGVHKLVNLRPATPAS